MTTSTPCRIRSRWCAANWALWLVAAAALVWLLVSLMPSRSFDVERWARGAGLEDAGNPRWSMIEAVQTALRVGMTDRELLGLLGEPDWHADDGSWLYAVGRSRGPYSSDPKSLQVELDERRQVVRWSVGY
ncbi:MAG: hypothetical protein K8T90_19120 [Planctomycetes bacterium]|nr:hypothetical protein [Planctomycetota bacterium]